MRIAIVTTSFPHHPGDAAGHFVETEARRLARAGARVTVLAPGSYAERTDGVELRAIRDRGAFGWPGAIERLRERPTRALGASEFVLRALLELRASGPYDRVVAHFLVPSAWPIASRALGSAELEVVCHGSDVRLAARLPRALRRRIVRELVECGARFRFVSSSLRDELARTTLPEIHERAVVEPSPIDMEGAPTRVEARRALGLTSESVALIVARLIGSKNVASALGAIALVPGLSAVVVGDGPLRAELAARFPEARFVGRLHRPEALRWIAAADVFVSASSDEGAPTAVREARALGVPVASVAAGDLTSWARSDRRIFVV